MLHFAGPQGSAKIAMMASSRTHVEKQVESNSYSKKHGGVENGIRAEKDGKQPWTALRISHEAACTLFFLLLLVVTVFTQVGGPVEQAGPAAVGKQEIKGFHFGNDTGIIDAPPGAQTTRNQTANLYFSVPSSWNDNLFIQAEKTEIVGNFGNQTQNESHSWTAGIKSENDGGQWRENDTATDWDIAGAKVLNFWSKRMVDRKAQPRIRRSIFLPRKDQRTSTDIR